MSYDAARTIEPGYYAMKNSWKLSCIRHTLSPCLNHAK